MKIRTSMLSNKIYAGDTMKDRKDRETWTKKEDVTEQVIRAVFENMYNNAEETGIYEISIEGFGKMTFKRTNSIKRA